MHVFPQHLCYGLPFLPPLTLSRLVAGISKFDPAADPGTPLLLLLLLLLLLFLLFCTLVKLHQRRLNYLSGEFTEN